MSSRISRRDFIIRSAAGVVVGTSALSLIDIGNLFASSTKASILKAGGDIIIKLSDPKNAPLTNVNGSVLLDDENILIRISQTQFLAVNLICGHKGCTVELTGNKFVCPCHGSEYDLNGKFTQGPTKKNLETWQTSYDPDKGIVTIKMTDKTDGNAIKNDSTKVKDGQDKK